MFLCACGKSKKNTEPHYEIVDGRVVEVTGEGDQTEAATIDGGDPGATLDNGAGQAAYDGAGNTDGTAATLAGAEDYNSIDSANPDEIEAVRQTLNGAAQACIDIYTNADKGESINANLSGTTLSEMLNAMGQAGYCATDSNGDYNMQNYTVMDDFGKSVYLRGDTSGTYIIVYPDGHLSAFNLSRKDSTWHLISMSGEWDDEGDGTYSFRIFSEGRYAIGGVQYTDRGWLIYSRNISDFDENQRSNTGEYTMVKILPYDSNYRYLAEKYIEPIGYFENNLFTTDWDQTNFTAIDFNCLYAYLFGMYNGTEMLSSYNIRDYYKTTGGTKLYVVPAETFENTVTTYFNVNVYNLRGTSDYSYSLNGYYFLGYNYEYYNVTPRTPSPEVTGYTQNSDGSISITVSAVNRWYGTDRAFTHIVTVMPQADGFKYVSNILIKDEDNILPEMTLDVLRRVEMDELS